MKPSKSERKPWVTVGQAGLLGCAESMLAGDAPTPKEFGRQPAASGERDLWRAVLEQAILDAKDGGCVPNMRPAARDELRQETRGWFESDELYTGSFVFVAHVLDLNPEAVRVALRRRWRTKAAA